MLQNLAPDLWILDHPQRLPGGLRMSTRMTIVRLPGGDLWLHSAVPLSDADAAAIDALGPVRHIVAPNLLHHLYLAPARARWPAARVWAPPGLRDKRPDLAIDAHLTGDAPTAWAGAIAALPIDGAPAIAETVFIHRPSATLIVGDLVRDPPRRGPPHPPRLLADGRPRRRPPEPRLATPHPRPPRRRRRRRARPRRALRPPRPLPRRRHRRRSARRGRARPHVDAARRRAPAPRRRPLNHACPSAPPRPAGTTRPRAGAQERAAAD